MRPEQREALLAVATPATEDEREERARAITERVLRLLPVDGTAVLVERVHNMGGAEGLRSRELASALTGLCADGRVAVEPRGGYSFARRVLAAAADFPLRARPHRPPPRRFRPEARR